MDESAGEKITVVKCKKEIVVTSFGGAPIHIDREGRVIPHGFTAESFVSGHTFICTTKVEQDGGKVQYCFTLKEDGRFTSGWKKSPTGALDTVNKKMQNDRHKIGTNGQIMIGVTYEPVQIRIRQVLGDLVTNISAQGLKVKKTSAGPTRSASIEEPSSRRFKRSQTPQQSLNTESASSATPAKRAKIVEKDDSEQSKSASAGAAGRSFVDTSKKPFSFHPTPTAYVTTNHPRTSSQAEIDEIAFSSQPSLDLAALDVNSQDQERFFDRQLGLSSQQSLFGKQSSEIDFGSAALRQSSQLSAMELTACSSLLWRKIFSGASQ